MPYFVMQERKGHGSEKKGFFSKVVGTFDSVFETKQTKPFRILLQTPRSEVSYMIATAFTALEINEDWAWLASNMLLKLEQFTGFSEADVRCSRFCVSAGFGLEKMLPSCSETTVLLA
jgi:hypothetical protein